MQLFSRQQTEDGPDLASKCAPDHADLDMEEPDNEDHLPIPLAVPGGPPGKTRDRSSIRDWSDDDCDDCVLLEVLDPSPISFAYPLPSTSVDPDEQDQDVPPGAAEDRVPARKRTGTSTSDAEAATPPAKKKKIAKKPGNKGTKKPTSTA